MQNEHGLVARRAERLSQLTEEIERAGGVALPIPADLASEAERERVVAAVRERWRRIDVLKRRGGLVRLVRRFTGGPPTRYAQGERRMCRRPDVAGPAGDAGMPLGPGRQRRLGPRRPRPANARALRGQQGVRPCFERRALSRAAGNQRLRDHGESGGGQDPIPTRPWASRSIASPSSNRASLPSR